MEHKTLEQLRRVAELHPDEALATSFSLSKNERLERWIQRLEEHPDHMLDTLHETEHEAPESRSGMRSGHTPISVAFEDPVLRAAGLTDDSYGEARRFFELSDADLHWIVCFCHSGAKLSARSAARRVRSLVVRQPRPGLFALAWRALTGR